jgi:hypothetical protein
MPRLTMPARRRVLASTISSRVEMVTVPPVRHCIARVHDRVHDDLLNLAGVDSPRNGAGIALQGLARQA